MKHFWRVFFTSILAASVTLVVAPKLVSALTKVPRTDTGLSYTQNKAVVSSFSPLLKPLYFDPKKISIAKLGLNSALEAEGVVDGRIGVPSGWEAIGYFTGGAQAGEAGNVIIVGHLDDNLGRPAVFWNIKVLSAGDEIRLSDGHRIFTYRVLGSAYVPDGSGEPLMENLGGPGLILVTCGGVWNPVLHNYSQRLLVKAVLVS